MSAFRAEDAGGAAEAAGAGATPLELEELKEGAKAACPFVTFRAACFRAVIFLGPRDTTEREGSPSTTENLVNLSRRVKRMHPSHI